MATTGTNSSLAISLDRIQATLAELHQTEALEAQVHEMVTMKRRRLDSLLTEHMQMLAQGTPSRAEVPAPVVSEPPPVSVSVPVPAAAVAPTPSATPAPRALPEDLPLTAHGGYGAPKDLLQGRPAPSAQHVLDSLNRLMAGIKDISGKQVNAA